MTNTYVVKQEKEHPELYNTRHYDMKEEKEQQGTVKSQKARYK
jgi:hypothetical protein